MIAKHGYAGRQFHAGQVNDNRPESRDGHDAAAVAENGELARLTGLGLDRAVESDSLGHQTTIPCSFSRVASSSAASMSRPCGCWQPTSATTRPRMSYCGVLPSPMHKLAISPA